MFKDLDQLVRWIMLGRSVYHNTNRLTAEQMKQMPLIEAAQLVRSRSLRMPP